MINDHIIQAHLVYLKKKHFYLMLTLKMNSKPPTSLPF